MAPCMALDSTEKAPRLRVAPLGAVASSPAWRCAVLALVASRLLILDVGAAAVAIWGLSARAAVFDPLSLTHGLGTWGDPLAATLARWDSTWFLQIADHGYGDGGARAAFFPLYPLAVRVAGFVTGSALVGGVLVSVACLLGALVLLHRLTALELDIPAADATVWLVALFPVSFFGSAVYSESLFLLLSVGAVYAARTDRWAWAGALAALAALTRSAGAVLVVPLALLWWRGGRGRRALAPALALAAVPLAVAGFCAGLALAGLPADAPFTAQRVWMREFAGPFVGVRDGAVAAWQGARQLLSGQREHVYFTQAGGDPFVVARMNLMLFGFLVLGAGAVVGVLRRLRVEYAAYVVAALALPLSYPVGPQPLMSLPRFELVLFPLFMWAGWWVSRPRRAALARPVAYALSAGLLVVLCAQFATWHWVA